MALKGYEVMYSKVPIQATQEAKTAVESIYSLLTYCDGMINFKANFSVIILLGLKIHQHENMKSAASLQIVCFRPYSRSHLLSCPDARNFREL